MLISLITSDDTKSERFSVFTPWNQQATTKSEFSHEQEPQHMKSYSPAQIDELLSYVQRQLKILLDDFELSAKQKTVQSTLLKLLHEINNLKEQNMIDQKRIESGMAVMHHILLDMNQQLHEQQNQIKKLEKMTENLPNAQTPTIIL